MRWWQILLVLGAIGSAERYFIKHFMHKPAEAPGAAAAMSDQSAGSVQRAVAAAQSRLPLALTDDITIDEISYKGRTIYYHGASRTWFAHTATEAGPVGEKLQTMYCSMPGFARADVSVEFDIVVPPASLEDRRSHVTLDFSPQECVHAA